MRNYHWQLAAMGEFIEPQHCAHCALYYWRLSEMYMSLQWPRREQTATRRAYHYEDDSYCGPQFDSDYHTMIENAETFFLD